MFLYACVSVRACVRVCVCVRERERDRESAVSIVSMDKILCFTKSLSIIIMLFWCPVLQSQWKNVTG